ncbi:tRNA (adenine(22)-N(1))-methyltransferase [Amphibacillus sediminis]|uniref:tRNA (adenine(22)-N(1))-methyltransferase n=1 Tax=Amphibacillus sediminis TaxID=360185 RepID=UPI000829C28C|nr:tRNA (adenine(22)-N(1))-methyltransferase TrmK [Amphibacillus sediminis]
MNENVLSSRLQAIASYLPKGAYFADIGSDHAYLPVVVCRLDPSARAIAGELNDGPYQSALAHVRAFNLSDQIEVIKGDGLTVLGDRSIKQIVIAGMGGGLIRTILDQGKEKLAGIKRLILQPNVEARLVRDWLVKHNFCLIDETILKEDGHIYEILVAEPKTANKQVEYTEQELLFGPILSKQKNTAFYHKWKSEQKKRLRILAEMQYAKQIDREKINQFEKELAWINEVLKDE